VKDFANEFRRINYVTPTSFLELLSMYKKILLEKRNENDFARMRLSKGLDVLKQAAIEVDEMQKQLEAAKPVLEQTSIEITETQKVIEKDSKVANEIKAVATVDEENATKVAAEVKGISDEANAKLAEAEPALEKAVRAVKDIKVGDFYEMRGVNTPGQSIVTCFKLLCFFLTSLVQGQKAKKPNEEKKA
jgi:dynein heavy chain